MNWKSIILNIGYALLVSALFMFMSVIVSILNGNDSALAALIISFTITFIVGIFPFFFVRRSQNITLKEGYVIITLAWLLSFVFGMLPYALWGGPFTIENAWFESVSGFTTTGATILEDIEALPKSLLFWRSATHFIGGLGVVVFLLLIIPNSSPIKLRLANMELSSLSKVSYSSRINRTVYIFANVYLALALVAFVSYLLAGMPFFDAICHAMSVCASGGFSTRNLSIASFDSRLIEGLTMIFMFVTSLHFGLVYMTVVTRSLKPMDNPVVKFYVSVLVAVALIIATLLRVNGFAENFGQALWFSSFQTLCATSTTGFAITDNAPWPMSINFFIAILSLMCGCAGSTAGGVKADRVLVFFKSFINQVGRTLHPTAVNEVHLGKKVLHGRDTYPHVLYLSLYSIILGISICLSLLLGVDNQNAFAASVSSLGNVGPAVGSMGLMGNFNGISAAAKFLFSVDMFLGRVEIYPALAVAAMIFDRRRA